MRIDKAFSWDAPLAVHGMLQTVIANAWRGDPYPVEVLFLYMANMAWNSAMNPGETMRMLADKDPATGEYRIPRFIYADAFHSETVAYADLVLPDTTYLERWDCISLLDRPIGTAHGPGDAIRQPVVAPDRDVRPFQEVLIDLGVRLRLPAFAHPDGEPRYPGGYPDYLVHHQRKPGIGPLAGWRGAKGDEHGPWRAERAPARGLRRQRLLLALRAARPRRAISSRSTAPISPARANSACSTPRHRSRSTSTPRCCSASGSPPRGTARCSRRTAIASAIRAYFDPLPFWYQPFEQAAFAEGEYPAARDHPAADADVPQLGLAECLAAPDPGPQLPLHEPAHRAPSWASPTATGSRSRARTGVTRAQLRLMDGCAENTVWTWNAIGKRAGAWGLAPDAPEAERGFLLNHVIGELLPEAQGYTHANADPITGQAAWFDLRVRVPRLAEPGHGASEPALPGHRRGRRA